MKQEEKSESEILRQKAEELLNTSTPLSGSSKTDLPLSEIEMLKLIHELEIHHVELELQNHELQQAKALADIATDKYTELYDFAPSGYFTLSETGDIIECNLTSAKMLDKERSKLINNRFSLFISIDTQLVFNLFLEKIFESKRQETCEVTLIKEGATPTYVLLTGIITENIELCNVTMVDITKRKRAEEKVISSENRFTQISENSREWIWEIDIDGLYTFSNQTLERLMGYKTEEIVGKKYFYDFFPPEEREEYKKAAFHVFNNKQPFWEFINRNVTKSGEIIWLSTSGVPILDNEGTLLGYRGVDIDITAKIKADKDLRNALEKATESDRLKSAFLANMSHEIRTPMNGILGFASLLKEPDLSGKEQQQYVQIIEKSGARMLNIINNIVSISKIESGLMEVDICESNINEQIEYIYTFFKAAIEGKGMQFLFKSPLPSSKAIIKTDREKLYAILTNLVKNAIKYSEEGIIELGYVPKGKYIEFYVKDSGIGIKSTRQEAIFERFIQADITDKNAYQGAGLGLSISKAYVEMLGGKLWVESEKGIGSTFYFTIPYSSETDDKKTIIQDVTKGIVENKTKNLKILIAEDDETSEMLMTIEINAISKEILIAKTGIEAVEVCRNNPDIDLILMDIQMPEINGYEATRQIRKFNKEVIIIAQTAYGLSGDREKAIEAECNDYISKPIRKDELMALIQKYFKK